jgi:ABC-type multidrug transport system fused ATPase/permease subunit
MIKEILKENKLQIASIYSLLIIQYGLFAIMPYLLGKAIDDLLKKNSTGLVTLLIAEIAALLLGFFLKRYDTKVFMKIFCDKAIKAVQILRDKNILPSKIAARYQLVGFYSDFFEYSLPQIINSFIGAGTALTMLYITDHKIGLIASILFFLMILVNKIYSFKTQKIDLDIQNNKENVNHTLIENLEYKPHLINLSANYVKKSNLDAANFFFNDSLSIIMHVSIMMILVYTNPTVGAITSTLLYVDKLYGVTYNIFYFFMFMRSIENTNKLLHEMD